MGSDPLPNLAVALGRRLRAAGLPATPERAARFTRAVDLVAPTRRDDLYWLARAIYTSRPADIPPFDAVFAVVFDGLVDPADSRGDPNVPPLAAGPSVRTRTPEATTQGDRDVALAAASSEERLAQKSFADLDEDELATVAEMMRRLVLAPPVRRGRRREH